MGIAPRLKKAPVTRKPVTARSDPAPNGRDNILRAAATLFGQKGYTESGLREIAEMAGVRPATVYHHFASKEKIYEEISRLAIDVIFAEVNAQMAALPPDATPRMRVEASIAGHLRALHGGKPFTSTNAHSRVKLPPAVNRVIGPIRERYSSFWRAMLNDAKKAGALKPGLDPKILRALILSTLNRTLGWYDPKKGDVETLIEAVVTMHSGIWADSA